MANDIIMPALGMAQDTGIIVAWHKQLGDPVKASDVLMEVETDKATVEVEAGHDGFLTAVRAETGVPVPVGEVIAVISADKSNMEAPAPKADKAPAAAVAEKAPESEKQAETQPEIRPETAAPVPAPAPLPAMQSTSGRILASPKAKRLAKERGIDLGRLVRLGVAQPIHAGDLDKAGAAAAHGATASLMRIRVDKAMFGKFLSWFTGETGETADTLKVWTAFAAGSFRKAAALGDDAEITVHASRFFDEADAIFLTNPDQAGLGGIAVDQRAGQAALAILDLTDTPLAEYRPAGGTPCPQLIIANGENAASLDITLVFEPESLPAPTAMIFLKELAARAEQPLRHLL